jgi:hypothetical protein
MSHYKRSQVEDTLWPIFKIGAAPDRVPAEFRSRVNKLLNLDRMDQPDLANLPLAFNDTRAEGQGQDVPFTSFHAFMLGLGLELWNAGLRQSDVIYFLRHSREALKRQHSLVIAAMAEPENMLVKGKPVRDAGGIEVRDKRIYMLVAKRHFGEASGSAKSKPESIGRPMVFVPEFVAGSEGLKIFFDKAPSDLRAWLAVEIAELAVRIETALAQTPPRRRGRPS